MANRLIHTSLTATLFLVGLATSCGVTGDARPIHTQTLEQALAVADFVLETDPPIPEQYDTGNYPSVAAGGTQRLAVFEDGARIRGVRFNQSGAVLDLEWLDFGLKDTQQYYPAVAYGGDRYLVVWAESDGDNATIYAQTVTLDGQLGERHSLGTGYYAQASWLGDAFLVSFTDYGVHLARVDTDGALIPDSKVQVSADSVTSATRPVITATAEGGYVAFSEDDGRRRNVRVARFDATGTVLDPGGVVINPNVQGTSEYALAATPSHALVTFRDEANALKASLLSSEGSLGPTEFDVTPGVEVAGHAAGSDGIEFVVVWNQKLGESDQLRATRVTANGTLEGDATPLRGAPSAFQVTNMDLDFSDGAYALVYEGMGVWGEQFSPQLEAIEQSLALSALPNAQNVPFGSWNGTDYVVSWVDERGEGFQARAIRVSKQGLVLDPEGIAITSDDRRAYSYAAASNTEGTTAFVYIDDEDSNAYLRTMNANGELTAPVLLAAGRPEGLNVASNGSTFLVGYQLGPEPTSQTLTLYAQPLDAAGTPVGSSVVILPEFSRPRVSMVAQGQNFLVTYSGQAQGTGAPVDGKMLRVSASGEPLAELEAPAPGNPYYTAATNPDGAVVFGWNDINTNEVWFRVLNDDTWTEPKLLTAQLSDEAPAFGWNGERFASVWVEERTALWTREVGLDGSLGEESVAVIGDHTWPKFTLGPGPELLLTSVHWELFSRTRRIESRFVGADGTVLPNNPSELDATGGKNDTSATGLDGSPTTPRPSSSPTTSTATNAPPVDQTTAPSTVPSHATSSANSSSSASTTLPVETAQNDTTAATVPTSRRKSGCNVGLAGAGVSSSSLLAIGLLVLLYRRKKPCVVTTNA